MMEHDGCRDIVASWSGPYPGSHCAVITFHLLSTHNDTKKESQTSRVHFVIVTKCVQAAKLSAVDVRRETKTKPEEEEEDV